MSNYKINSHWGVWYHSINDSRWTRESYKKIMVVKNLLDYYFLKTNFEKKTLQNGMFFIMRGDILPTWEDPDNRLGGCLSFKIYSNDILNAWNKLFLNLICEDIALDEKKYDEITGLSISPKKEFNIIKIWLKNDKIDYKKIIKEIEPFFKIDSALYRKHELEY
jgi:hypothetical protein